ncbi:MAG: hypothetical protein QXT19_03735 [Candidatus Woesearchaeota archaeon]
MTSGLYYVITCNKKITWELVHQIVEELNKKGFDLIKEVTGEDFELYISQYFRNKKYVSLCFINSTNHITIRVEPYNKISEPPELVEKINELIATTKQLASEMFGIKSIEEDWI